MNVKVAIIGAGPAGLALSHALKMRGINDFVVLERESEPGGLCRSALVDGSPLDIGGGHFLDVRRPVVTKFLFGFMPEGEWNMYERDSRISIHGQLIGSPLEANIWQLDAAHQEIYLHDIAEAGCNRGDPCPVQFVNWIYWKLGRAIAEDYMLPYNRKIFGDNLNKLGTYWLEKLPNVSYEDTLRSCREHHSYAIQPGHATFYYPKKYGYGEVWRRMGEALGDRLLCSYPVRTLDAVSRTINDDISADFIVNTSPWTAFENITGLSDVSLKIIASLKHVSIDVDYVSDNLKLDAQWLYLPDEKIPEHRWLLRHNFCPGARGYWRETRSERNVLNAGVRYTSEYAYPLNTIGKNEAVASLLAEFANSHIYGLGRWGEWQHYNSDVVVERALNMAKEF